MKSRLLSIASWLIVLWTTKVFLFSLPYKFSGHPDTVHIFSTIGNWMAGFAGTDIGGWFSQYGAFAVGSVELITSLVLLSPLAFWLLNKASLVTTPPSRQIIHAFGGIMAAGVMAGAVFFHLFTPLGIAVIHEGKSDNGSLFYAAVSILVLGTFLFSLNFLSWKHSQSAASTA